MVTNLINALKEKKIFFNNNWNCIHYISRERLVVRTSLCVSVVSR